MIVDTRYSLRGLLILWLALACLSPLAFAQVIDPQNLLIQNVRLIEPGDETVGVLVSILIKNNKLELVTKDQVPLEEVPVAVDAKEGYLFGKLVIGETPSFIILDEDPRANFEVLLNTNAHTLIAIHDGKLFRNKLWRASEPDAAAKPKKSGWLAYTPPPLLLPLVYSDTTKWNRWETKYVSGIFLGAALLDRQQWLNQDSVSRQQSGNLDLFDGGEIRALRFGAVGTLNFDKPWVYTIFGATNAFDKGFEIQQKDSFSMLDYRLDVPLFNGVTLSVGKQKEPISMERIMSLVQIPMQERTAVSDALLPSRNFGAVLSGTAFDKRMTWAGSAFNDWIDTGSSFSSSSSQVIGRITWLPFISEDESNLLHLGFGARYSNAKEGLRARTEPEFNKSPIFVDTGEDLIIADNMLHYSFEASWRKGPYWLAGEYLSTSVDSAEFGNPGFSGYHLTASWVLSGEMRPYQKQNGIFGPIPIAQSVYQDGWGAWEIAARISSLDLNDGLVDGGEIDVISLGVNWWLTPFFNVSMNYRYVTLDRFGDEGNSSGVMTRLLLILE